MQMLVNYLNVHVHFVQVYTGIYISVQCTTLIASQPKPWAYEAGTCQHFANLLQMMTMQGTDGGKAYQSNLVRSQVQHNMLDQKPTGDQTEMHQTEMNQTESFLHQQKTRVAHRRHWAHWGLGRTHPHANMGPHHLWPIRL